MSAPPASHGSRGASRRPRGRKAPAPLPRWVAVLGTVLLLGELAGAAALLARGSDGVAALGGGGQTVVLKVDGVLSPLTPNNPETACRPDCHQQSGPGTASVVWYRTPAGTRTWNYPTLPFTTTVRVPAGGAVTLDAASGSDLWVTCSILLNGRVIKKDSADASRDARCSTTIPPSAHSSGATAPHKRPASAPHPGMRTVILRIGGLSSGDTLDYQTPAGSERDVRATSLTFTKTLRVYSGGVVTLHAFTGRHDPITCSIAADGRLLLQSSANQRGEDFCQATIP